MAIIDGKGELTHLEDPEIPADDVLPCGCYIHCAIRYPSMEKVMTYNPCTPTCRNLQLALEVAKEKDAVVRYEQAP